jgi:mycothiol system anti-sigma-R factor
MPERGGCDDSLHELYSFLDGELTESRRAEIKRHLDDCPPCFEQFDFEAELRLLIAQKCRDTVPESLRERIARTLGADPSGPAEV